MPGERRDFNSAAATWDENPIRRKLAEDVARAIRATVPMTPEMDLLDLGCGTGLLTLSLQPAVRSVTGADSSQGMLDVLNEKIHAGKLTNIRTLLFDPDRPESLTGEYDIAISSMTFHHIPDIPSILSQLNSHIRPGGKLCIADLDSDGGRFHESPLGVFHNGFDRAILKKQLEDAGFRQIRNRTAAVVHKRLPLSRDNAFTVFLMTATKADRIS